MVFPPFLRWITLVQNVQAVQIVQTVEAPERHDLNRFSEEFKTTGTFGTT
jgi:hypothetical protein